METTRNSMQRGRMKKRVEAPTNPYCSFLDDRERRRALISRDVRIVLVRAFWVIAISLLAISGQSFPALSLIH
jgi:hypothetical protein